MVGVGETPSEQKGSSPPRVITEHNDRPYLINVISTGISGITAWELITQTSRPGTLLENQDRLCYLTANAF